MAILCPLKRKKADKIVGENGHSVSYRDLCEIIRARVEELMRLVVLELPRTDYARLIPSGIVITGGCANLPGIVEVTQNITHLPVRIGVPPALNGVSNALLNDPAYATSVGLILWKMKNDNTRPEMDHQANRHPGFVFIPVAIFPVISIIRLNRREGERNVKNELCTQPSQD